MPEGDSSLQPELIPPANNEKKGPSSIEALHLHQHQNNFSPQIYLNVPPQVALPPADEFNKYSEDVRKFWIDGAKKEQDTRLKWIETEQQIRFDQQRGDRGTQRLSMICGTLVILFIFGLGGWLLLHDKPFFGGATVFTAVGAMIASVIYGRIESKKKNKQSSDQDQSQSTPSQTGERQ